MKLTKLLIVLTLMFSTIGGVYAVEENGDAPCTAVSDSTADQAAVVTGDEAATESGESGTGQ